MSRPPTLGLRKKSLFKFTSYETKFRPSDTEAKMFIITVIGVFVQKYSRFLAANFTYAILCYKNIQKYK